MTLRLPSPAPAYSVIDQETLRAAVERSDAQNHKKGRSLDVGRAVVNGTVQPLDLILADQSDGKRYALRSTNGVLSLVEVTV